MKPYINLQAILTASLLFQVLKLELKFGLLAKITNQWRTRFHLCAVRMATQSKTGREHSRDCSRMAV